jgi:signal transduction histidine kinase
MDVALAVGGWLAFAVAVTATLALRQALAASTQSVNRACHEIRGPLAAAMLGVESSVSGSSAAAGRLRAVRSELRRAAAALDDLQGVGGPETALFGQLVDVESWLRDSVEAWSPVAELRDVPLRLTWEGPAAFVMGARPRLVGATGNLIANAIEHAGGSVEVRGRVRDGRLRIEVQDGGPGLSAPVTDFIGRAGRGRARRSSARRTRGHGLAIAQAIAEAHGGSLRAAPSSRGATMVLELPVAKDRLNPVAGAR